MLATLRDGCSRSLGLDSSARTADHELPATFSPAALRRALATSRYRPPTGCRPNPSSFFDPFEPRGRIARLLFSLSLSAARRPNRLPEWGHSPPLLLNFVSQVSNFLFRADAPFGTDLLAMDINRGRDMGIPPYTTMRTLCGLPPVNRFEDLKDAMDEEVSSPLRQPHLA